MQRKYIEDLDFLIKTLEKTHPDLYFYGKKSIIEKAIIDFKNRTDNINDSDFYYFIKTLLKQINDPHTTINSNQKKVPLKLKIINGNVYILESSKEYSDYLLSKVTRINDIPISILIKELEQIVTYSTFPYFESCLETELATFFTLLSLPIIKDEDQIIYTLDSDGEESNLSFHYNGEFNYDFIDNRPYFFDYNKEDNVLIIKYKSCREDENKSMLEFIKEINLFVCEHNISDIILDIRGNKGGNSRVIKPLIEYLYNRKFNIISLVDKDVFSSSSFAVVDLKKIGSKFVGTEIGTELNHFGNCENFSLPNTNFNISCSKNYFFFDGQMMRGVNNNYFLSFKLNDLNRNFFLPSKFLPDFYVENSVEDYELNYDRQLDFAIKQLKADEVRK